MFSDCCRDTMNIEVVREKRSSRNKVPIYEVCIIYLENKILMFMFPDVGLTCYLQSKLTLESGSEKNIVHHKDYLGA